MRIPNALWLLPALLRQAAVVEAYTPLSDSTLQSLPEPGDDFDIHTGALLAPILRPRVPGSEGSRAVLDHFVTFFGQHLPQWKITFQNSSSVTPTSNGQEIPFANIIATRDPPWTTGDGDVGRLALVAHYDSKLTPTGFIGATDSAAPCAMLLHAARTLDAALTKKWDAVQAAGQTGDGLEADRGVQILLLDGEEAFRSWTSEDSLYGAKSLAEEWEVNAYGGWNVYSSPLSSIELFVLLDLLGAPAPVVPSFFKTTHWAYKHMADAEVRLRQVGKFQSSPNHPSKRNAGEEPRAEPMFLLEGNKLETSQWKGGAIEDDHVPFMARGVEILHIIAAPFPDVWHTIHDDGEHLDLEVCNDWALLTIAFAAEWLDLEGYFDFSNARETAAERHIGRAEKDELQDLRQ